MITKKRTIAAIGLESVETISETGTTYRSNSGLSIDKTVNEEGRVTAMTINGKTIFDESDMTDEELAFEVKKKPRYY